MSGGPVVLFGGPAVLSGGPALLSGGPAVLSGGPAVLLGGPAVPSWLEGFTDLWYPTYRWGWGCEALSLFLEKAKNSRSNRNKSSSHIVHLKQCKRQAAHKETSTLPGGCRKRTQGKQNLQGSCGQSRKNQVRKSEMKLCSGNPCDAGTKEPTEAQARPKEQEPRAPQTKGEKRSST